MFKRNVTVAKSHQLSGKDAKKVLRQVAADYPALDVKSVIPSKTEVTVSKLSNKALVYSVAGDPVFFEHEGKIYPTVYTLARHPALLPTLFTHSQVSPKIVAGADLMLPGVILPGGGDDLQAIGAFAEGEALSVSIPENPVPFAVGLASQGSEAIKANGLRGRGVKLLHHFPDALWGLGSKRVPNAGFKPARIFPVEGEEGPEEAAAAAGEASEVAGAGAAAESLAGNLRGALTVSDGSVQGGEGAPGAGARASGGAGGPAPASMDELVDACFLRALHVAVKDSDLPLDISDFYSKYMLPSRPRGTEIDVKKSSYKKVSKLVKKMEKRGLITAKSSKKEDRIASVNRTHEAYVAFQGELARLEEEDNAAAEAESSSPSAAMAAGAAAGGPRSGPAGAAKGGSGKPASQRIQVFEMYRAVANLRPVFGEEAVRNKDLLFSADQVKAALVQYAVREQLAEPGLGSGALRLDKLLKSGLYVCSLLSQISLLQSFISHFL